jgi:hypothetical protein
LHDAKRLNEGGSVQLLHRGAAKTRPVGGGGPGTHKMIIANARGPRQLLSYLFANHCLVPS